MKKAVMAVAIVGASLLVNCNVFASDHNVTSKDDESNTIVLSKNPWMSLANDILEQVNYVADLNKQMDTLKRIDDEKSADSDSDSK